MIGYAGPGQDKVIGKSNTTAAYIDSSGAAAMALRTACSRIEIKDNTHPTRYCASAMTDSTLFRCRVSKLIRGATCVEITSHLYIIYVVGKIFDPTKQAT